MCGQLQTPGRLTFRQRVLVLVELEQVWGNFLGRMPKFSIEFEEIVSRANGISKSKIMFCSVL
jgi:hypothetical protein